MTNIKEVRMISDVEFRTEDIEDKKYITGYALKFNTDSKDLGGFTETIERSAVEEADMSDVVALFNHDQNMVLARKNDTVDTLELIVDETGLKYRFEVDTEISYVKDLYRNIKKGNISKSSFAFRIAEGGDKWEKREDGTYKRTITKFKGIYDVSPVTNPAYSDTDSAVRTFNYFIENVVGDTVEENNLNEYRLKYVKSIL